MSEHTERPFLDHSTQVISYKSFNDSYQYPKVLWVLVEDVTLNEVAVGQ